MKRTERHHLKENLLATWISGVLNSIGGGGLARNAAILTLVVLVLAGGTYTWLEWRESQASESLARAMSVVNSLVLEVNDTNAPPPAPEGNFATVDAKLEAALPLLMETANSYPSLQQGVAARYQAASALGVLGRTTESGQEYEKVIDSDPDGLYGGMSRLGRAEVFLASEEYNEAIGLLQEAANQPGAVVPLDAVLMRLGKAYALSGQTDEAVTTFRRVINETNGAAYRFEATQEIEILGGDP